MNSSIDRDASDRPARSLNRERIDSIVKYEREMPDVSAYDSAFRETMAQFDRNQIHLAHLKYYWGMERAKLVEIHNAERQRQKAAGELDEHGRQKKPKEPVSYEVILAFGYCIHGNPLFWKDIENERIVDELDKKLSKQGIAILRYEDDHPEFDIEGYDASKVIASTYRGYFHLKYAPNSDPAAFSEARSVLTVVGPIEEIGEEAFLREIWKRLNGKMIIA